MYWLLLVFVGIWIFMVKVLDVLGVKLFLLRINVVVLLIRLLLLMMLFFGNFFVVNLDGNERVKIILVKLIVLMFLKLNFNVVRLFVIIGLLRIVRLVLRFEIIS